MCRDKARQQKVEEIGNGSILAEVRVSPKQLCYAHLIDHERDRKVSEYSHHIDVHTIDTGTLLEYIYR